MSIDARNARRVFIEAMKAGLPEFLPVADLGLRGMPGLTVFRRRWSNDVFVFAVFQKDGPRFTIECATSGDGTFPAASRLSLPEVLGARALRSGARFRLGSLLEGGNDKWWSLRNDETAMASATAAVGLCRQELPKYLEKILGPPEPT